MPTRCLHTSAVVPSRSVRLLQKYSSLNSSDNFSMENTQTEDARSRPRGRKSWIPTQPQKVSTLHRKAVKEMTAHIMILLL